MFICRTSRIEFAGNGPRTEHSLQHRLIGLSSLGSTPLLEPSCCTDPVHRQNASFLFGKHYTIAAGQHIVARSETCKTMTPAFFATSRRKRLTIYWLDVRSQGSYGTGFFLGWAGNVLLLMPMWSPWRIGGKLHGKASPNQTGRALIQW